jgi:predicted HNH restriction endonuclease
MDRQLRSILSETPTGRAYLAKHHAEKSAARSRRRSRTPRVAGKTPEQRRAEKRAETSRIREAVILLAGEMCERCGYRALAGEGHAHHTLGGIGRRLAEQSIANVAWVCPPCHRTLHQHPEEARFFREQIRVKRGQEHSR